MSRFFSSRYRDLEAYVPGEQPKQMKYIKLNTNESPFPPPRAVGEAVAAEAMRLPLYPDPECTEFREHLASMYGVSKEETFVTNGSDDILNFAFMAFVDPQIGVAFADITYGFYEVFAQLHRLPYRKIPLLDDFSLDLEGFKSAKETLFIANPNAPTGIALSCAKIEELVCANPNRMVVIDEAYVEFGAESCLPLLKKYDNLLVVRTFSKSRSLAGGRLGYAFGRQEIIAELNTLKYSMNPYNVNRLTLAAGQETLRLDDVVKENCRQIQQIREKTSQELKDMGFFVTDSLANFLFVHHPQLSGEDYYNALKRRGILVRHFKSERIAEFNRISIGNAEDMGTFCRVTREILEESKEKKL